MDQGLTKDMLHQAKTWLEEQKDIIPKDVVFCLSLLIENILKGEGNVQSAAKGFHELLVKFGFKPSSEKRKSHSGANDPTNAEKVEKLAAECRKKYGEFSDAKDALNQEMENTFTRDCAERDEAGVGDVEKAYDQEARHNQPDALENDLAQRLAKGNGPDPALTKGHEDLFPKAALSGQACNLHFSLSQKALEGAFGKSTRGLEKEKISTERFDFSIQVNAFRVTYETARDPRTGRSVSAAPESLGPKGAQITYRAIVNVVLLAVGFLIPTHRISRLLGGVSYFDRANLLRYMGVAAEKFLPIYLELGKQLSNAKYLWADATPTRVNEVNRSMDKRTEWVKNEQIGPPEPHPWEVAQPPEEEDSLQESKVPLWRQLQIELGLAFEQKNSRKRSSKTRHQTIVVHGRSQPQDPSSHIFFFRSCLGDVGNVLDHLLELRTNKEQDIFLQCDHSSANVPTNPAVLKRHTITLAGCFAHARRKFKKHESQDPQAAGDILTLMYQIPYIEHRLDKAGRNRENTLSVRRSWGAHAFEIIYFAVQKALQSPNWSDQTPLGKAGRHFIKHYQKLTVYLAHPELEPTNNSCERALRPEKLAQGSSYFRDTLEGRARFDILRTIYQTCSSANVPFSQYLLYILMQPKIELERNPTAFTPYAFKKALQENPNLQAKLDRILQQGH